MERRWHLSTGATKYQNIWGCGSDYAIAEFYGKPAEYWLIAELPCLPDAPEDVGPFDSFEAAAACFEVINKEKL